VGGKRHGASLTRLHIRIRLLGLGWMEKNLSYLVPQRTRCCLHMKMPLTIHWYFFLEVESVFNALKSPGGWNKVRYAANCRYYLKMTILQRQGTKARLHV
jgi:hypothetical protein